MKLFSTIFLLHIFICSLNAQVSIGTMAQTENHLPMELYYSYSYSQTIYSANVISADGDITGLEWTYAEGSTSHSNDIEIYLAHSSNNEFDNAYDFIPFDELSLVYDGTIDLEAGSITINFDNAFSYNGTDNLVIAVREKSEGYNSNSDEFLTTSTPGYYRSIYAYSDSQIITAQEPPLEEQAGIYEDISQFMPNVTLMGINQSCVAPTDFTVSNETTNTVDISWNDTGATSWNIYYKNGDNFDPLSDTDALVVSTDTNSIRLDNLNPSTGYNYYCQSICGDDVGVISGPYQFETALGAANPPYFTGFENGMPIGWTVETVSGNEWTVHSNDFGPYSGSKFLRCRYHASEATNTWAFTTPFNLEANTTYTIAFQQKIGSDEYIEKIKVSVGSEATIEAQSNVLIDFNNLTNTEYELRSVNFTPTEDGEYYFAINAYSDANQLEIDIDEFTVNATTNPTLFTEAETQISNYWYSSLDWGDYDNDGDLDLIICGAPSQENNPYELEAVSITDVYDNDGNGNLTLNENIDIRGVHGGDAKWIDFDYDGDLDAVVIGIDYLQGFNIFSFYENNNGIFSEVIDNEEGTIFGNVDINDYDNDGDLDMLISGSGMLDGANSYITNIWVNTENGFVKTDITNEVPGVMSGNVKWVDIDNDLDLDILIAGTNSDQTSDFKIYTNNEGTYSVENTITNYRAYSRFTIGDYDNDGDLDIATMVSDDDYNDFVEILENVDGSFDQSEVLEGLSVSTGSHPLAFGDYDNDGDLDLITNGTDADYAGATYLFENIDGTFIRAEDTGFLPVGAHSLGWRDIDGDLDIDLALSGFYDEITDEYFVITKLYNNNTSVVNTRPVPPTVLNAELNDGAITFDWSGASDEQTPESGLYYNLQVGTSPGNYDVAYYPVTTKAWKLTDLQANETFYWCVKSIDTSFIESECSEEQTFSTLGVNNTVIQSEQPVVYPNPVKEEYLNIAHLSNFSNEQINMNIYDITGKIVDTKTINSVNGTVKVYVGHLSTGKYFLELNNSEHKEVLSFIVQ